METGVFEKASTFGGLAIVSGRYYVLHPEDTTKVQDWPEQIPVEIKFSGEPLFRVIIRRQEPAEEELRGYLLKYVAPLKE